jgi:3-demethoxyubiquinol 3-hydroxylase
MSQETSNSLSRRLTRRLSPLDRLLIEVDHGLRAAFANGAAARATPVAVAHDTKPLSPEAAIESMRLMRVNHVGEVCAQALYQGQSLVARNANIRAVLQHAGMEERDHLAWCADRVRALGGRTSVLAPAFYAGAFALGVASGLAGDKWSMGFLATRAKRMAQYRSPRRSKPR